MVARAHWATRAFGYKSQKILGLHSVGIATAGSYTQILKAKSDPFQDHNFDGLTYRAPFVLSPTLKRGQFPSGRP